MNTASPTKLLAETSSILSLPSFELKATSLSSSSSSQNNSNTEITTSLTGNRDVVPEQLGAVPGRVWRDSFDGVDQLVQHAFHHEVLYKNMRNNAKGCFAMTTVVFAWITMVTESPMFVVPIVAGLVYLYCRSRSIDKQEQNELTKMEADWGVLLEEQQQIYANLSPLYNNNNNNTSIEVKRIHKRVLTWNKVFVQTIGLRFDVDGTQDACCGVVLTAKKSRSNLLVENLEKLYILLRDGGLTQEEYNLTKSRVLNDCSSPHDDDNTTATATAAALVDASSAATSVPVATLLVHDREKQNEKSMIELV